MFVNNYWSVSIRLLLILVRNILRWPAAIFGNGGDLFSIEFWSCKREPISLIFGNRNNKCSNVIKL